MMMWLSRERPLIASTSGYGEERWGKSGGKKKGTDPSNLPYVKVGYVWWNCNKEATRHQTGPGCEIGMLGGSY